MIYDFKPYEIPPSANSDERYTNIIMVFATNLYGKHEDSVSGKAATNYFGAKYCKVNELTGFSYGIPIKSYNRKSYLSTKKIKRYINDFLIYAKTQIDNVRFFIDSEIYDHNEELKHFINSIELPRNVVLVEKNIDNCKYY